MFSTKILRHRIMDSYDETSQTLLSIRGTHTEPFSHTESHLFRITRFAALLPACITSRPHTTRHPKPHSRVTCNTILLGDVLPWNPVDSAPLIY